MCSSGCRQYLVSSPSPQSIPGGDQPETCHNCPKFGEGHKVTPDARESKGFLLYMPLPLGILTVALISAAAFGNERAGGLMETPCIPVQFRKQLNTDISKGKCAQLPRLLPSLAP